MKGDIEDIWLRTALHSFNISRTEANFFKSINKVDSINVTITGECRTALEDLRRRV